ncbi:MAG: Mpo1-like protein [Gemmatimonadota bacterium]
MLGDKPMEEWVEQYATSHQHPVNRFLHTLGIPIIVASIGLFGVSLFVSGLWPYALGLFVVGWIFQFVGHAFEGKPPEFLRDWRFLFVGLRWWLAKIRGRA